MENLKVHTYKKLSLKIEFFTCKKKERREKEVKLQSNQRGKEIAIKGTTQWTRETKQGVSDLGDLFLLFLGFWMGLGKNRKQGEWKSKDLDSQSNQ